MKNQYFGDVGDFGKYGLLTALSYVPLKLGINWYLTKDDAKPDGKYTEYLAKTEFKICDQELHGFLNDCIQKKHRNVNEIKKLRRFENLSLYDEVIDVEDINALSEAGRKRRIEKRNNWFESSLIKLSGCELIFCDPDNGIEPRSLSGTSKESVKYVHKSEICKMIDMGSSLVVYNHRDRSRDDDYKEKIRELYQTVSSETSMRVLRFNRYSVRDYIVLMNPKHSEIINKELDEFLGNTSWKRHFSEVF